MRLHANVACIAEDVWGGLPNPGRKPGASLGNYFGRGIAEHDGRHVSPKKVVGPLACCAEPRCGNIAMDNAVERRRWTSAARLRLGKRRAALRPGEKTKKSFIFSYLLTHDSPTVGN